MLTNLFIQIKQERQCTYNITLRCIRITTGAVEKHECQHNLALSYLVCKVHTPYCHLQPVQLYNIFPNYLKNGTILEKKITEHKMCIFSTTFV